MAENIADDIVNDDDLVDEALDRTSGGKLSDLCGIGNCRLGRS